MDPSASIEEFWDDLLAFIEAGSVIPVVGAELLTIREGGVEVPLYRVVAQRLLAKYGVADIGALPPGTIRAHNELRDAVAHLAGTGRRVRDLYRPVHDLLTAASQADGAPLPALASLAEISHFSVFATTTPDQCLAQALNAVRYGGARRTEEIEYAPKLPTERRRDIPEVQPAGYSAVFYLFGKSDVSPFYAIHDEDALEFPFTLQQGSGPERVFGQLRSRNLLFIGCHFAEWLSRFFIRMAASERLFSDQRSNKEFLVDRDDAPNSSLTVFLEQFSRDSRCYPADAHAFVTELHRRWRERNPPAPPRAPGTASPEGLGGTSLTGSIFVSYARQDAAAAKELVAALTAVGGDVAWFDKEALTPGDEWNRQIHGAIQRCALFLPVISANTEGRSEGYFREEWKTAAERARRIQGRKFIIPIVVDPEYSGEVTRYELVPDVFRDIHFGHAPSGRMTDALLGELTEQLRALRRGRTA